MVLLQNERRTRWKELNEARREQSERSPRSSARLGKKERCPGLRIRRYLPIRDDTDVQIDTPEVLVFVIVPRGLVYPVLYAHVCLYVCRFPPIVITLFSRYLPGRPFTKI